MSRTMFFAVRIAASGFALGAATLAIATADAQQTTPASEGPAMLRSDAIVESDVVTLGDLVDRCGAVCARPLFRAPAPGETGTIQALRIIGAAREAGLREVESGGVAQIVVRRLGRSATRDEVDSALALAIGARVSADAADLSINFDQATPRVSLSPGAGAALDVSDLIIDTRTRRFTASIGAPNARSVAARVTGAYAETVMVPVLTRSLQRGDAVRAEDIAVERRDRDQLGDESAAQPKLIEGRVSRVAMRAGTILRERDLVKPLVVDRNMIVTMTLDTGALQLTLRGKAVDQGAVGDVIGVQNLNSKRVVQGVVTGPGVVRIQPGAVAAARTAAIQ